MKKYTAPTVKLVDAENIDILTTSGIELPEVPISDKGIELPEVPISNGGIPSF